MLTCPRPAQRVEFPTMHTGNIPADVWVHLEHLYLRPGDAHSLARATVFDSLVLKPEEAKFVKVALVAAWEEWERSRHHFARVSGLHREKFSTLGGEFTAESLDYVERVCAWLHESVKRLDLIIAGQLDQHDAAEPQGDAS